MSLWTMIFMIVLVSVGARVVGNYMSLRYGRDGGSGGDTGARLDHLEHRLDAIEKRLRNVETITTNREFHLRNEFENLKRE